MLQVAAAFIGVALALPSVSHAATAAMAQVTVSNLEFHVAGAGIELIPYNGWTHALVGSYPYSQSSLFSSPDTLARFSVLGNVGPSQFSATIGEELFMANAMAGQLQVGKDIQLSGDLITGWVDQTHPNFRLLPNTSVVVSFDVSIMTSVDKSMASSVGSYAYFVGQFGTQQLVLNSCIGYVYSGNSCGDEVAESFSTQVTWVMSAGATALETNFMLWSKVYIDGISAVPELSSSALSTIGLVLLFISSCRRRTLR